MCVVISITGNLGRSITKMLLSQSATIDRNIFTKAFDCIHGTYQTEDEKVKFESSISIIYDIEHHDCKFPELKLYQFDDVSTIESALQNCSHVLTTVPPIFNSANEKYDDVVLERIYDSQFQSIMINNITSSPIWFGYVSTTGVYGNHDGDWVTELSATRAPDDNPKNKAYGYLGIEKEWEMRLEEFSSINEIDCCLNIFRSSGIYSNEASALHTICKRGSRPRQQQFEQLEVFTSRIHLSDASRAIISSMCQCHEGIASKKLGSASVEIYNLSDSKPALRSEVMQYAWQLLQNTFPSNMFKKTSKDLQTQKSERAKRRLNENKKVDGSKMRGKLLKNMLLYPTYKEGLTNVLDTSSPALELLLKQQQ